MSIFEGVQASIVSSGDSVVPPGSPWAATVQVKDAIARVLDASTQQPRVYVNLPSLKGQHGALSTTRLFIAPGTDAASEQPVVVALQFSSTQQLATFRMAALTAAAAAAVAAGEGQQAAARAQVASDAAEADGSLGSDGGNVFDTKMDKGSADLYFHYYGMLQHQQNMLQDVTRTGTYYSAILENSCDFAGKVVMDVGAGSGILSLFAAQAGAAEVYAVEASGMAKFAAQLAAANPPFGNRVKVLHSKVEEVALPPGLQVDVLVSEPMGTLLVNERMLETYLYARDHFLRPGGAMYPALGRIHAAAFSDVALYSELYHKATFWTSPNFYGVNLTNLHHPSLEGYFSQVVVDAFDPGVLVSDISSKVLDFRTVQDSELHDIAIPLDYNVVAPCTIHGIACWFDVLFDGSSSARWLSTAPGQPTTHWFQLRCVLQQPMMVLAPQTRITGTLRLVAHERQSYDVLLELEGPPLHPSAPPQKVTGKFDLKEPYYRQLTQWPTMVQQQTAGQTWDGAPSTSLHSLAAAAVAAAAGVQGAAAAGAQEVTQAVADAAGAAGDPQQQQQQQQQVLQSELAMSNGVPV